MGYLWNWPSGMSDWSEAMAVCMLSHTCTPGPRLKEGPDEIPLARGNTSAAVSPFPIGIPPSMAKVSAKRLILQAKCLPS